MKQYVDSKKLIGHIKDLPTWQANSEGIFNPDYKYPEGFLNPDDVLASIENATVLKIIRCKDCKYSRKSKKARWCDMHSTIFEKLYVADNDFCSFGNFNGEDENV